MQPMERTVNPYATFGPAETPGVSWHEYFTELKKRNLARKGLGGYRLELDSDGMEVVVEEDEDADDEPSFVVTEMGHIIPAEEYPTTPAGLRKRLTAIGWEVTMKRSRTAHEPLLYKGETEEHNRGDVRTEAHDQLHFAMLGIRYNEDGDEPVLAFQAGWDQPQRLDSKGKMAAPKFNGAITFDPILEREWRTRYLAPRKPDQWKEGQRVLAMAFVPWLDLVAPVPGAAIKKTQTSADLLNGDEWNG